jgi:hypothetical protein
MHSSRIGTARGCEPQELRLRILMLQISLFFIQVFFRQPTYLLKKNQGNEAYGRGPNGHHVHIFSRHERPRGPPTAHPLRARS